MPPRGAGCAAPVFCKILHEGRLSQGSRGSCLAIGVRDLDILRQLEILVGHAARIMRRARKSYPRVIDMNVRMMVGRLGDFRDLLHELDAVQKFLKAEKL